MNRRSFLTASCALPFCEFARAETKPWRARFLDGGFDGNDYWAGFAIEMSEGWKTYWRVPGAGGVPPQIDVTGANLKSAEVLFPLPRRFRDPEGESIGYKKEVVLPIRLTPVSMTTPLQVQFSAFFGICDEVCIPAQSKGAINFAKSSKATPDAALLAQWRDKVPKRSGTGPVQSAVAATDNGKPALVLALVSPVEEVFALGAEKYYFHAPRIEGGQATIVVSGAKSAAELQGQRVRLVTVSGGKGLEQELTVL
jgi:DsbC/DsbD-like thiol-disulfide interchange protein